MDNLKISDNDVVARATLTATNTSPTRVKENLQNNQKSKVWRATGTSSRFLATLAAAELVGCIALAHTNISTTGTVRYRISEEQAATNLYTYSEQFDHANWSKNRATVPATNAIAPDGTLTADTLQGDGTGLSYAYQAKTLDILKTYTASVFVKAGTHAGAFQIHDFTDGGTVQINLTTLVLTSSGNFSAPKLTPYPNGWYRLSAVVAPTSSGAKNIGVFNVNTVGNVLVWGAMLAEGALSSYYPTTGAAATRPAGYIDAWQSYQYDSGSIVACSAPAPRITGYTAAQAASAYHRGGGSHAYLWLDKHYNATGISVEVSDPNNLQGFLEVSRFWAGAYFEPKVNASYGASLTFEDTGVNKRTGAGDNLSDKGVRYRKLSFNLATLDEDERDAVADIFRANGTSYPMLVGLFMGGKKGRDHTVLGKLSKMSAMTLPFWNNSSAQTDVEES